MVNFPEEQKFTWEFQKIETRMCQLVSTEYVSQLGQLIQDVKICWKYLRSLMKNLSMSD